MILLNDDVKRKIGPLIEISRNAYAKNDESYQIKNFLMKEGVPICGYKTYVRIRNGKVVYDDEIYSSLLENIGYIASNDRDLYKMEQSICKEIKECISFQKWDELRTVISSAIDGFAAYGKDIYVANLANVLLEIENHYLKHESIVMDVKTIEIICACVCKDAAEVLQSILMNHAINEMRSLPLCKKIVDTFDVKNAEFIELRLYYATYLYYTNCFEELLDLQSWFDNEIYDSLYHIDYMQLVLMLKVKQNMPFEDDFAQILSLIQSVTYGRDYIYASLYHILLLGECYSECNSIENLIVPQNLKDENYMLFEIEIQYCSNWKKGNGVLRKIENVSTDDPLGFLYEVIYMLHYEECFKECETKMYAYLKKWKKEICTSEIGFIYTNLYRYLVEKTRQYKHYFELY